MPVAPYPFRYIPQQPEPTSDLPYSSPPAYSQSGGRAKVSISKTPIPFGYGLQKVSAVFRYGYVDGNDFHTIWTLAEGEIDAIGSITYDGAADATVIEARYYGTMDQAVCGLNSVNSSWTERLPGTAYLYLIFDKTTMNGLPSVQAVCRLRKIYDPRKDDTNGGSGDHRLDDPSTWEYSTNPALCRADFLINNRFGQRIPAASVDWASVADAADYCDAEVTDSVPVWAPSTNVAYGAYRGMHQLYGIGDSLTDSDAGSYLTHLRTHLGGKWACVHCGVAGNTTTQMVSRFNGDVLALGDAEYVLIWGGTNDILLGYSLTTIKANLQSMYTDAKAAGIRVVAISLTPWKSYTGWTTDMQAKVDDINAWIAGTATDVDVVVDVYSVLEDPGNPDTLLPAYDYGDHLHINTDGQAAVADAVYSAILAVFTPIEATPGKKKFYACRQAGVTASTYGPSGTGILIADNTAKWNYLSVAPAGNPRYEFNYLFDQPRSYAEVANVIELHFIGAVLPGNGKYRIEYARERNSVATFTVKELRSVSLTRPQAGDTFNRITVSWTNTASWATQTLTLEHPAIVVDGAQVRERSFDLKGTQKLSQATRVALCLLNSQVNDLVFTGTTHNAQGLEKFDVFTVTHPIGIVVKQFQVTSIKPQGDGSTVITGMEYDPAVFDDGIVTEPTFPDSGVIS